jgi:hypothetical protein
MNLTVTKIDLTKEYKSYYNATKKPELIKFDEAQYLSINGIGAPAGDEFNSKVQALYPLAFGVKNLSKKAGRDYVVPKLEGLWWVEDKRPFMDVPREEWHWQLLNRLPEFISIDLIEKARTEVIKKKKIELVKEINIEKMKEGHCVQILHIGPYSTEPETIDKIFEFIMNNDLVPNGLHHEIYLSDPRNTAPEKMKTILRQPVQKK